MSPPLEIIRPIWCKLYKPTPSHIQRSKNFGQFQFHWWHLMEAISPHYFISAYSLLIEILIVRMSNHLHQICIIILERRVPSRVAAISHTMGLFHTFSFTFHSQWIIDWSYCFAKSLHCSKWSYVCQHPRKDHLFLHTFTLPDSLALCHMHLHYLASVLSHIFFLCFSFSSLAPVVSSNVVKRSPLSVRLWYWSVKHHPS